MKTKIFVKPVPEVETSTLVKYTILGEAFGIFYSYTINGSNKITQYDWLS